MSLLQGVWTNWHQIVKKWLQSVDGRGKSERCSKARSRQVVPILKTISPLEFDVKELFNRFILRND